LSVVKEGEVDVMAVDSCVFCEILAGESPASMVYEDPRIAAFMDIRPVNPGHVLVVPRIHAAGLSDLGAELGAELFQAGMRLAGAIRRSQVRCEGINLFLADGRAAGQEVFHVHLHVVPRFSGDGFGFRFAPDYFRPTSRDALDEVATSIRHAMER
jgi:histidine triad (HIT) family protein